LSSFVTRIDRTWDGQSVPEADVASVRLTHESGGIRIDVRSPFHGDPPPPGSPGPTDSLWNFEIVEVFLAGHDGYLEVELGPWGHYLVLELGAPRVARQRLIPIEFTVTRRDETHWEGTAVVPLTLRPAGLSRYNAYRIHGTGTARRHLARFPVPGLKPDFHRLDCFGRIPEDF